MAPESLHSAQKTQASAAPILGLDGLRAFAVLAVLLYHAPFEWMRGGFLGVEVFFVISGFLITGLLVKDYERHGRIALGRFWQRRLRRLLPALAAFLLCVSTVGACFLGTRASQFRVDLPMSMVYLENWYQIHSGNSYFADQGWPLLRHLWSLAVEGQFYLAWPFLVAGTARCFKGRTWPLVVLSAILAAGSFGLMVRLADPGNLSSLKAMASLNRAYLGTDTRAFGLLAGALLALVLNRRPASRAIAWSVDLGAVLALTGLGFCMVTTGTQAPFLYRGGLLMVDALTMLVIAALVLPSARLARAILGQAPLEWIGRRSYGLYLWHWPVFRLLAPGRTELPWFGLKVLVALGLTEACYRWVETPIRRDGFRRGLAAFSGTRVRRRALRLAAATLIAALAWETKALADRAPYLDPVAESIRAGAAALDNPAPATASQDQGGSSPATASKDQAGQAKTAQPRPWVDTPIQPVIMPASMKGVRITAIGDSVMKGAAIPLKKVGEASLGAGMIQINAEECRSFSAGVAILKNYKHEDRLGDVVVVHLGTNNSSIPSDQFNQLMGVLADRRSVIFLTAKSDKVKACQSVNQALESLAAGRPNVRVLDWQTAAEAHPEYFYSDQTHLRPEGARRYAELILNQVAIPTRPDHPGAGGTGRAD